MGLSRSIPTTFFKQSNLLSSIHLYKKGLILFQLVGIPNTHSLTYLSKKWSGGKSIPFVMRSNWRAEILRFPVIMPLTVPGFIPALSAKPVIVSPSLFKCFSNSALIVGVISMNKPPFQR
ncbi:hypothetical protein D3C74_314500 [compost metagenome]